MFRSVGWQELVIIVVIVAITAFWVWLFWRIFSRTGMNPALSLLILIPYVGPLVVLLMLAFSRWPALEQSPLSANEDYAPRPRSAGEPPAASVVRVPAGWLPDPVGERSLRYWDGAQWTSSVHD